MSRDVNRRRRCVGNVVLWGVEREVKKIFFFFFFFFWRSCREDEIKRRGVKTALMVPKSGKGARGKKICWNCN